jgi:hypothetical protein
MKGETKEERFKRVAEKRVQNIIEHLRKLSQCSNKKIYEWNDDQLNRIWDVLDKELERCKASFTNPHADLFKL